MYTVSTDMTRGAKFDCVNVSLLRQHKCEQIEFYPRRQTPSHPIIMHKIVGLCDTSDFCLMYSYVIGTM